MNSGTLFIVATPIGNLEDITLRALRILEHAHYIACEDTRRTGQLLTSLKIRKNQTLIPYYDQTEQKKAPEIIELLEQGNDIALVSDAGTPLLNDPGFLLVREAIKRNIKVQSLPGASALLAALTTSGLPTNQFTFLGYPPEKSSHRIKLFEILKSPGTYIFYCAPHKLEQTLRDLQSVLGDIEITIARELTKIHEEVWCGKLSEALTKEFKGEIVLLFSLV